MPKGIKYTVEPEWKMCTEKTCTQFRVRDGLCMDHWKFYFDGLSNHQRMVAKQKLREFRTRVKKFEQEQANAATN